LYAAKTLQTRYNRAADVLKNATEQANEQLLVIGGQPKQQL